MDDNGATQVLEPTPETQTDSVGGGSAGGRAPGATGSAGGGRGRTWLIVAVLALLALAAAVVWWLALAKDGAQDAQVSVPDVRGMTLDRAGDEVQSAELTPGGISYAVVEASVAPSGTVLTQEPLPGALVARGSSVDIVLAQGPVLATVAQSAAGGALPQTSGGSSGSGGGSSPTGSAGGNTPPPPEQAPVLPELPPAESIDFSQLQPRLLDPGAFKLIEPTYTTVLEHSQSGGDWQSPSIMLNDKPKRISLTADGPLNEPMAVWTWGPSDVDWVFKNFHASGYGALEGSTNCWTYTYDFNVGAGSHAVLVRSDPDIIWWKVKIEQQN